MASITNRRRSRKGFTLIELAMIIAVVGILAAVGAVKYASMSEEAKKAGVNSAIANARSALAMAIAKDTDGKVSYSELSTYLENPTVVTAGTTFKLDNYNVTYSGGDSNISSITGATYVAPN